MTRATCHFSLLCHQLRPQSTIRSILIQTYFNHTAEKIEGIMRYNQDCCSLCMKTIGWDCISLFFDLQWKHFKRITSILLCNFLLKIMVIADFLKDSKTQRENQFSFQLHFQMVHHDVMKNLQKKVWFKGTQSSRIWPIQQFFETVGSSFYDLSPMLPQIFVWVLILKKRHSNWVWFLFFFKTKKLTFTLSWVTDT